MTVTKSVIALIAKRLRDPRMAKLNQSQIAEHLGLSKAWASKFMGGKIGTLTDEQVQKLETFLEIKLRPYIQENGPAVSALAEQLSLMMADNEPLNRVVADLINLVESAPAPVLDGPKWIETQDMTRIGQEIIRIAFANEDKPGKVARLVLELLA